MPATTTGGLTPTVTISLSGVREAFDSTGALVATMTGMGATGRLSKPGSSAFVDVPASDLRLASDRIADVDAQGFGERTPGDLEFEWDNDFNLLHIRNGAQKLQFTCDLTAAADDVIDALRLLFDASATDAGL